jgi:hypothetical protein
MLAAVSAVEFTLKKEWALPSVQIQEYSDRERELIIKGYTEIPEEEPFFR